MRWRVVVLGGSLWIGGSMVATAPAACAEVSLGADAGWLRSTGHADGYDFVAAGPRVAGQLGVATAGGFMTKLSLAYTTILENERSGRPWVDGKSLAEIIAMVGARLRRPTFVVDLCLGADWGFLQRQAGFGETQALPLPRAAASVRRRLGSSHSLGGEISVTGVPGVESFTTLSVVYEWGS